MSVSHVTPSFLHSHRHLRRHTARAHTGMQRRHRANLIMGGIGIFLAAVLITAFIGVALTLNPNPHPNTGYAVDGSSFLIPAGITTMWLAILLMDAVAIFAYGLFTAHNNQQ
ncbi:MAG: hypothetical protein J2P23_07040 [Microlunatus sp.]|nr:hypothetical protein [Microlunatus sp.]